MKTFILWILALSTIETRAWATDDFKQSKDLERGNWGWDLWL